MPSKEIPMKTVKSIFKFIVEFFDVPGSGRSH
jgi:hypothetical protein